MMCEYCRYLYEAWREKGVKGETRRDEASVHHFLPKSLGNADANEPATAVQW